MECSAGVLRVILLIKSVLDILSIAVPTILVIMIAVDIAKAIMNYEGDFKNIFKKIGGRIIAACALFFVPLIVNILLNTVATSGGVEESKLACWDEATEENIIIVEAQEKAEKKAAAILAAQKAVDDKIKEIEKQMQDTGKNWKELNIKVDGEVLEYLQKNYPVIEVKEVEESTSEEDPVVVEDEEEIFDATVLSPSSIPSSGSYRPLVNGVQLKSGSSLPTGACMKDSDKCACPTYKGLSGFYFTMRDATGRDFDRVIRDQSEQTVRVTATCSDNSTISKYVNPKYANRFQTAFDRICLLQTTGIDGVKLNKADINLRGTVVTRLNSARTVCSLHSYGIAIDVNYSSSYTIKGRTYRPYSSMGASTKAEYDAFVKALGKEDDPRNINYILWKYAFQPAGFSWGGNWSTGSFDPMHFEIDL